MSGLKEISESIRVFVRQRPQLVNSTDSNSGGLGDNYDGQVAVSIDQTTFSDKKASGVRSIAKDRKSCQYYSGGNNTSQTFNVDKFFMSNSSQEEVFDEVARPIVDSTLLGYSGTILAYGPTSSGKTHTMRGAGGNVAAGGASSPDKGIMPRCIERLLEKGDSADVEIWASYLQIYCENVTDLLSPVSDSATARATTFGGAGSNSSLVIRDKPSSSGNSGSGSSTSSSGGVYVEGLSRYRITTLDDLWELLRRGDENRSTASTNLNETSSRSHAALMVTVVIKDSTVVADTDTANYANTSSTAVASTAGATTANSVEAANNTSQSLMNSVESTSGSGKNPLRSSFTSRPVSAAPASCRSGTLVLVDLAGSERATASEGRGFARLEEAKAINLSLSALGNCMSALAESRAHIPYRDAKLTRLLQGCLGGGARTAVVVTLCPGDDSTGESLSALRFASRASRVKVVAKVSRYQDYESLYKDALNRIKLMEVGSSAERKLAEREVLLREHESTIEAQAAEISNLKQQLHMLKQLHSTVSDDLDMNTSCNDSGINYSNNTTETATAAMDEIDGIAMKYNLRGYNAQSSINSLQQAASSGSSKSISSVEGNREEWTARMNALTKQHLNALDAAQRDFQYKTTKMRQAQELTQRELLHAQEELNAEKKRRLESVTELREMHERSMQSEDALKARVAELLLEVSSQRDRIEDYERAMYSTDAVNKRAEQLQMQMLDMVSKEQVQEMEALFLETVTKLSNRVNALEGTATSTNSYTTTAVAGTGAQSMNRGILSGKGSAITNANATGTTIIKHAAAGSNRSVRLEPGGKIRSSSAGKSNAIRDNAHPQQSNSSTKLGIGSSGMK